MPTAPPPPSRLPALGLALVLAIASLARGRSCPAADAGSSGTGLVGRFARPEQTIEYHFMLRLAAPGEDSLAALFATRVAWPLRGVAAPGSPGAGQPCGYVDSPRRGLWRHHLIVRVRDGQITVKARSRSPGHLLDLEACGAKKYELDRFAAPEYSISSDLRFGPDRDPVRPEAGGAQGVWDRIAAACPELWARIRPAVTSAGACELPGVARMYTAAVELREPTTATLKEAGLTVWYFPPTARTLVELAFTGYVKDRAELERLQGRVLAALRANGLLAADQSSKTQQYFAAYAGQGHLARAAGTGRPPAP